MNSGLDIKSVRTKVVQGDVLGVSSQYELGQGLPRGGSLQDTPARVSGSYEQSSDLQRVTILTSSFNVMSEDKGEGRKKNSVA